jgi:hypothetical protein
MIVIMLSYAFWDYLGTGPMWQNAETNALLSYCPQNWWQNALYINNMFDFDKQVRHKMNVYITYLVHRLGMVSGKRHAVLLDYTTVVGAVVLVSDNNSNAQTTNILQQTNNRRHNILTNVGWQQRSSCMDNI